MLLALVILLLCLLRRRRNRGKPSREMCCAVAHTSVDDRRPLDLAHARRAKPNPVHFESRDDDKQQLLPGRPTVHITRPVTASTGGATFGSQRNWEADSRPERVPDIPRRASIIKEVATTQDERVEHSQPELPAETVTKLEELEDAGARERGVHVHQDGGRALVPMEEEDRAEIPPSYESIRRVSVIVGVEISS